MNRIDQIFANLRTEGRKALIPFISAGDPDLESTVGIMHALADNGADLIEVGIPFSDPMADGSVIQLAYERAIRNGTDINHVLDIIEEFRRTDSRTGVVLMGYLNPIERMGHDKFAERASAAGVDSVLMVDLPPEEGDDLRALLLEKGIYQTFLIAPTSTEERLELICNKARGFLYYVAIKGVTGASLVGEDEIRDHLTQVGKYTSLPVAIGFGIKTAEDAHRMAALADAAVIGSALVETLAHAAASNRNVADNAGEFLAPIRHVLDN